MFFLECGNCCSSFSFFCYCRIFSWTCAIYDSNRNFYILVYWNGHFGWFLQLLSDMFKLGMVDEVKKFWQVVLGWVRILEIYFLLWLV